MKHCPRCKQDRHEDVAMIPAGDATHHGRMCPKCHVFIAERPR